MVSLTGLHLRKLCYMLGASDSCRTLKSSHIGKHKWTLEARLDLLRSNGVCDVEAHRRSSRISCFFGALARYSSQQASTSTVILRESGETVHIPAASGQSRAPLE